MKKTIHIIFPEYTATEYRQIISEVNRDIYTDNAAHPFMKLFVRILAFLFFVTMMFLGMFAIYSAYGKYVLVLEGGDLLLQLCGVVLMFFLYLTFALCCSIDIKNRLYRIMHLRKRTETYSLSKFSEKQQQEKKKYHEYAYHEACDRLRSADVTDMFFQSSDNGLCKVTVTYMPKNGLDSTEEKFKDIRLVRRLQDAENIDLWLDLDKKELTVYTPGILQHQNMVEEV